MPRSPWIPLVLSGVLSLSANAGASDAYLEALRQEAARLAPAPSSLDPGAVDEQTRADFEAELRRHHRGTYAFYQQLPADQRRALQARYLSNGDLDALRRDVLQHYLAQ